MDYNNNDSQNFSNEPYGNSADVDNTPDNLTNTSDTDSTIYEPNRASESQQSPYNSQMNNPYNNVASNQQSYNGQGQYNGQNAYNNANQYNGMNSYNNQNQYNNPYDNPYNNNMYYEEKKPSNGYAVASLILGLLSLLLSCCYGIGLVLAIPGLILGFVSKKHSNGKLSGMAIGGIICSIIGLLISIFMLIAVVTFLSSPNANEFLKQLQQQAEMYQ